MGVPAAQSACYGLRYRFGAWFGSRTMLTHALRMPNAYTRRVCTRKCVRDRSGKPAMSVANEDLQRIARPRSDSEGDTPK